MFAARISKRAGRVVAPVLLLTALVATSALAQPRSLQANPVRGMAEGASVSLDGRLQVLIEDYPGGRVQTRHYLQTARGRVELLTEGRAMKAEAGSRVRLRGRVTGEALTLDGTTSSVQVTSAAALPAALGEQRVAVILVNFQDDTSQPMTREAANTLVFETTNIFYRQSSFGQTWLNGRTFDWVTVPYNKSTCVDGMLIAAEADKAVAAAGGDLSGYNRKVYMFPRNACSWSGLALVNENPSMAWINGSFNLKAVGHELGHNLGLRHAHALDCDISPTGDTCTRLPYGDAADLMGNVRTGDFSPYAKERMGWLNDGVSPPILVADRSGRYTIEPYASGSVGAKAIKVPRGTDANGTPLWFYLDYRLPLGVDAVLDGVGNLAQGVMVRTVTQGDGDSIHQIDMTPNSAIGGTADLADGALTVGRSYVDPLTGSTISVASVSATGAVVDVSLSGSAVVTPPAPEPAPVCTRAAPAMSLTATTTSAAAGSALRYAITLSNADSSTCAPTTFNLAASVPAGWAGVLGSASVTLSPGTSANTTLDVTSTTSATAGTYGVGAGAGSAAGSVHTVNAGNTYTVLAPTLNSSIGTDKSLYLRGQTVYMSSRVMIGTTPVSGAAVTFVITLPNGRTTSIKAKSGRDGYARASYRTGKTSAYVGQYALRATVVSSGKSASSATTGFAVK
ncbi:NEW3 domain-containing protein [Aerolutibacter daejeonensis]|uniref:NEW3 domain-containing protein n=1 Tax=Aerolutibacter daejeonensis TaxID=346181 RepID=UPI00068EDA61|nr:NEW3 domain-containing protein [Lysobacter daejeonensis]